MKILFRYGYKAISALISFFILFPFMPFSLSAAHIEYFTPEGTVKNVRQVKVIFSEEMTSIGSPGDSLVFDVTCPVKGKGRWIDSLTWIYDFDSDLPGGLICRFRTKKDLRTLKGSLIEGRTEFSFTTGGPYIIRSIPEDGDQSIESTQIFALKLDCKVDENSLKSHVWFSVEGIKEKIGVNIIRGNDRKAVLACLKYKGPDENILLLQSKQTFPHLAKVSLVLEKGIRSFSGIATDTDQVFSYTTAEPFNAIFTCSKEKPDSPCIPINPMFLNFNSDFAERYMRDIKLKGKDGIVFKPHRNGLMLRFEGPFNPNSEYLLEVPAIIRDTAGKRLANASRFPMKIKTGKMPSLAKFSARFGIIESSDPVLPLTLRQIETSTSIKKTNYSLTMKLFNVPSESDAMIIEWLRKTAFAVREKPVIEKSLQTSELALNTHGKGSDFRVIGIPLKKTGLNIVEIESKKLGSYLLSNSSPMYVQTAALVTNMTVHFKKGQENSLVWVTTLDKAKPVAGASVMIRNSSGNLLWQGSTDSSGISFVNMNLQEGSSIPWEECRINYEESGRALNSICGGYFIFARYNNDMTFTHSSWNEGIEPWRFQLSQVRYDDSPSIIAHSVLDRMLFKPGETVHMKHYVRVQTLSGFDYAKIHELPDDVIITHTGTYQQYKSPLKFSNNGSAEYEWPIPEGAKLGTYEISLGKKGAPSDNPNEETPYKTTISTGSFKIGDFKIPLMKATIQQYEKKLIRPDKVVLDLTLSYLSGGPASSRPVKLRSEIRDKAILPSGYESFVFNAGIIKTGIQESGVEFGYGSFEGEYPSQYKILKGALKTRDITLDKNGCGRVVLENIQNISSYKNLHTELEYMDPNGETQTSIKNIPLYPSSMLLGISNDSWNQIQKGFKYKIVALDLDEKPIAGQVISVDLYQEIFSSHRVRMVGGYYAYQNAREIKFLGNIDKGITDSRGIVEFTSKSPVSGSIILYAHTRDSSGKTASSSTSFWLAGKGDWWFEQSNDDRIDVIPERKTYEPGEKALFQVRMPFRNATALVSVEREGIIEAQVIELSGKNPVVSLPIKTGYAPNIFISVLTVRGRITPAKPTSVFDPGKPAYKLGIAEIKVGWKDHKLRVNIETDKEVYRIRDVMKIKISAKKTTTNEAVSNGDLTLAVVDEGLLELLPNTSWDILSNMMMTRGYGIETSTAQNFVIGRRHFGLKSLPHGGGGGTQLTRELFDTLVYWKGTVKLDSSGNALVKIPLNDSLTSFKIAAIAVSGKNLFGTGIASVRTSQDLMILSGVPQIAREGDSFEAGFTLRNAGNQKADIELKLKTTAGGVTNAYKTQRLAINPGESNEVFWTIDIPTGIDSMEYNVEAMDIINKSGDRIKIAQKILPSRPAEVIQGFLSKIAPVLSFAVKMPDHSIPGTGVIYVDIKPSITAGLAEIRNTMKNYPYSCLEQQASIAVVLADYEKWHEITRIMPSYIDRDGLLKYFPCSACEGSDVLTSYVLKISNQAGYIIPKYLLEQLLAGIKAFVEGRLTRRGALLTSDLTIRKLAALEAISRYEKIHLEQLSSIKIEPTMWVNSTVIDWINILNRVDWAEKEKHLASAKHVLSSRMVITGSQMNFASGPSDNLWWLMITGDVNASCAILALIDDPGFTNTIPLIASGLSSRLGRGGINTTTSCSWATLALKEFSLKFEDTPVRGLTKAELAGDRSTLNWRTDQSGKIIRFKLPEKTSRLSITHNGQGNPWAYIQVKAAIGSRSPKYAGFNLIKSIIPVEQKSPGKFSRGDVFRIVLKIDSISDMTWVVINDPIPAGSSIIKPDLGGSSILDIKTLNPNLNEAFTEMTADAFKKYYEFVPKGPFSTEYTIRLNCEGIFNVPPTRVEAIYAPEMYAELPNETMVIN